MYYVSDNQIHNTRMAEFTNSDQVANYLAQKFSSSSETREKFIAEELLKFLTDRHAVMFLPKHITTKLIQVNQLWYDSGIMCDDLLTDIHQDILSLMPVQTHSHSECPLSAESSSSERVADSTFDSDGKLHSFDGNPAITHIKNNTREWFHHGVRHRGTPNGSSIPAIENGYTDEHGNIVHEEGAFEVWKLGKLHNLHGPARCRDGVEEWRVEGELHRDGDLPAVTRLARVVVCDTDISTVIKVWYRHGKTWRENGKPTEETESGIRMWYNEDGILHRDDGPALMTDCYAAWYDNGKFSRKNGQPARIFFSGEMEWREDGVFHRDHDLPACMIKTHIQTFWTKGREYVIPNHKFGHLGTHVTPCGNVQDIFHIRVGVYGPESMYRKILQNESLEIPEGGITCIISDTLNVVAITFVHRDKPGNDDDIAVICHDSEDDVDVTSHIKTFTKHGDVAHLFSSFKFSLHATLNNQGVKLEYDNSYRKIGPLVEYLINTCSKRYA